MPELWVSEITLTRQGNALKCTATISDADGPVKDALVEVKIAAPPPDAGWYFPAVGTDNKGQISGSRAYSSVAGKSYDAKVCAITKDTYTWNNRLGTNAVRVTF